MMIEKPISTLRNIRVLIHQGLASPAARLP
jgi:hypothetical protein